MYMLHLAHIMMRTCVVYYMHGEWGKGVRPSVAMTILVFIIAFYECECVCVSSDNTLYKLSHRIPHIHRLIYTGGSQGGEDHSPQRHSVIILFFFVFYHMNKRRTNHHKFSTDMEMSQYICVLSCVYSEMQTRYDSERGLCGMYGIWYADWLKAECGGFYSGLCVCAHIWFVIDVCLWPHLCLIGKTR